MNSEKYVEIIKTTVAPDLIKAFPHGGGVFQQDEAPCHASKKSMTAFTNSNVEILDWPGNSPDLNPIENLWAIVKQRLRKRDCTTKEKLKCAVLDIWFKDKDIQKICGTLVDSMPDRVKSLLGAKGAHIKY